MDDLKAGCVFFKNGLVHNGGKGLVRNGGELTESPTTQCIDLPTADQSVLQRAEQLGKVYSILLANTCKHTFETYTSQENAGDEAAVISKICTKCNCIK